MKALVVDDEGTTRLVLQKILSTFGEVHTCEDGSDAVVAHERALDCGAPYDLICMDLMMPTMGGLEALKLIRREEEIRGFSRAAKVVITTAADDADTIRQAFRESSDAYIVKPIDAEELINIVHCLFPAEWLEGLVHADLCADDSGDGLGYAIDQAGVAALHHDTQ